MLPPSLLNLLESEREVKGMSTVWQKKQTVQGKNKVTPKKFAIGQKD